MDQVVDILEVDKVKEAIAQEKQKELILKLKGC